jgi:hypothetical protein
MVAVPVSFAYPYSTTWSLFQRSPIECGAWLCLI